MKPCTGYIEVEDDITAYVEHDNGPTGVFVTTTGEVTGTNRFEVTGDPRENRY